MESTLQGAERKADGPTETTQLLKPTKAAPDGKATGPQLTLNLVVCGLGTGIFTLPWSTEGASCTVGVLIVAGVLALNAWTIFILIEAAEVHQAFDIGSLLSSLPGALGRVAPPVVNAVIWIGGFFCLVSYVIVIADCAGPMAGVAAWKLKALTSVLVLPLCFLDQRLLSFTSTFSVLAVILVFALMTSVFMQDHEASLPICMAGLSWGSVSMFASMMQTVVLQMCVLPMYGEMRNRSPGAFAKVVYWGFAVLFIVCASFALLGYFTFGSAVKSNVLLSLPTSRAGNLARLCAGASVVGVYPIILKPMIATLYRPGEGHDGLTTHWATGSVVAGVMMASLVLSDLGKLNIFNGAVSMGVFVAIVPFLVGCNLLQRFQQAESAKLALYVLLVLGLIGSLLALILDDNYAKELASVCAWPVARLSA